MQIYSLGQKPIRFTTTILIYDNPNNPKELDLTGNTDLYIEFRKPNGKKFKKEATALNTDLTKSPITYLNNEQSGSIIDMTGGWSYTGIMEKNGTFIKGVTSETFWVVP